MGATFRPTQERNAKQPVKNGPRVREETPPCPNTRGPTIYYLGCHLPTKNDAESACAVCPSISWLGRTVSIVCDEEDEGFLGGFTRNLGGFENPAQGEVFRALIGIGH